MSFIRFAGISCIAGAVLWIIALFIEYGFGLFPPGGGALFTLTQSLFALAELGFVVGILGLIRGRAAGRGWVGALALSTFGLSWMLLLLAQVAVVITGAKVLPALVALCWQLSMASALAAGIAVAAAQRWQAWQRYAMLSYGLYVALGIWLPRLIAGQQPALLTETIWGLAWLPVGLAIYARGELDADSELTLNAEQP